MAFCTSRKVTHVCGSLLHAFSAPSVGHLRGSLCGTRPDTCVGHLASVYTYISAIVLATRPQCEATLIATAAIQDDWKSIREVAEHLSLKKYEDMVRKYHLVRFEVFVSLNNLRAATHTVWYEIELFIQEGGGLTWALLAASACRFEFFCHALRH